MKINIQYFEKMGKNLLSSLVGCIFDKKTQVL